jgi:S1-C subfamily serine protease
VVRAYPNHGPNCCLAGAYGTAYNETHCVKKDDPQSPRRKGKECVDLLKFMFACVLIVPISFGQKQAPLKAAKQEPIRPVNLTTAQVAKRASPSVVVIQGKADSGQVQGSGFVISKDGKVVTNLHVIRDLKTSSVQLANGEIFDSLTVLAIDERRDLAIVQIGGFDLPVLELGNSDALTIAEPVVVVGSPRGLEGTVTAGILSSIRDSGDGFKVLQTDAAVNPGNSGGPLVNNKGQAIGVVSFQLRSAQGLNFAIPINYVRGLLNALHEPMTLEQMRERADRTRSAHEQQSPARSQTPVELDAVNLGSAITELRTHMTLESCSTDSDRETTCSIVIRIPDRLLKANLTFANDHLVRVKCIIPGGGLDDVLQTFVRRYGDPLWTDMGKLEWSWTANRSDIVLFPDSTVGGSIFTMTLKSYQADQRAGTASVETSLQETLDWLKEQFRLTTYRYDERIRQYIANTTVRVAPVKFDSCTVVFDVIKTAAVPDEAETVSSLRSRLTVPLGSLYGGTVTKVNKNYVGAAEDIEKWAIQLNTKSKVILKETHSTFTLLYALPFNKSLKQRIDGGRDVTESESIAMTDIVVNDEALAQRFLKAFRHASELCREKEPF